MNTTLSDPTETTLAERLQKQAYLATVERDLLTCQSLEIYARLQRELSELLTWFQEHPGDDEEIIRALNNLRYDEEMVLCHHSVVFVKGEPIMRQAYAREYRCLACGFVSVTQRNMVYHQNTCAGCPVDVPEPADETAEILYSAEGLRLVDETPFVEELVRKLAYRHTLSIVGPYRFGGPCLKLLRSYGGKLFSTVSTDPQATWPYGPGSYQMMDFPSYHEDTTAKQREIIRKLILDSLFLLSLPDATISQADQG